MVCSQNRPGAKRIQEDAGPRRSCMNVDLGPRFSLAGWGAAEPHCGTAWDQCNADSAAQDRRPPTNSKTILCLAWSPREVHSSRCSLACAPSTSQCFANRGICVGVFPPLSPAGDSGPPPPTTISHLPAPPFSKVNAWRSSPRRLVGELLELRGGVDLETMAYGWPGLPNENAAQEGVGTATLDARTPQTPQSRQLFGGRRTW